MIHLVIPCCECHGLAHLIRRDGAMLNPYYCVCPLCTQRTTPYHDKHEVLLTWYQGFDFFKVIIFEEISV